MLQNTIYTSMIFGHITVLSFDAAEVQLIQYMYARIQGFIYSTYTAVCSLLTC